jgi:hypothetical protein
VLQVLHTTFFWLLPWSVKKRLKATWFQFFAAGSAKIKSKSRAVGKGSTSAKRLSSNQEKVTDADDSDSDRDGRLAAEGDSKGRSRVRWWAGKATKPTAAGPLAEGYEGSGSDGGEDGGHGEGSILQPGLLMQQQQQQQQQQGAGAGSWTAVQAGALAIPILPEIAALSHQQQHQQQHVEAKEEGGLRRRSTAPAAASSSSSSSASPSNQLHAPPLPLGGSALDVALHAQQAQGVSAGVGGVGVFSDEWRRAARAMAGGTTLEVRPSFQYRAS